MFTNAEKVKIKENYDKALNHITTKSTGTFKGHTKPVMLISETYPGIWLEHVYDSVIFAGLNDAYIDIAKNTIELFLDNQRDNGQIPCYVFNGDKVPLEKDKLVGYGQVQECVSFARLCFEVCVMLNDKDFTNRCYQALKKWENWYRENRMTLNEGLVEMFVGYDTGHDNSGRLQGMTYPGNRCDEAGNILNAGDIPEADDIAPIIPVDMNCNFYATEKALAEFAEKLNLMEEQDEWNKKAKEVKRRLFDVCYDNEDAFFYDVDKNGNKRKYRSSTIFHLFLEGVLDKNDDAELIREIYEKHIKNPDEFWTEYPFPSMALNDPSCETHTPNNCWGYYSQALIALRSIRWMRQYDMDEDFAVLMEKWIRQWTFGNEIMFGQELDPVTGHTTDCSEWYSSCIILYIFAVRYLKLI